MNELNYQTPQLQNSDRVTAAWIALLVLGILAGVFATCAGLFTVVAGSFLTRARDQAAAFMLCVFLCLLFLYAVGCCIIYIWASVRVRRGSAAAARGASILCSINAALAALVCVLATVVTLIRFDSGHGLSTLPSALLWMFVAAGNATVAWLLRRAVPDLTLL